MSDALVDEPRADAARDAAAVYAGPFDRERWPERLTARVVSPGPSPRLHGYDVAGDLARHYGIADVAWLALCGELPDDAQRAAFSTALVLLAPTHLGQAPAHAAFLSRLIGALPSATVGVAATGLGELARTERAELAPWLAWLDAAPDDDHDDGGDARAVPACARAAAARDPLADDAQRWLDQQMRGWFGDARGLGAGEVALHRTACAYAILHRLGLTEPLAVELLVTWARLPAVIAEASFARPGDVRSYPARLPDYRYVDEQGAAP
jgi:hypothetical protein